MRSPFLDRRVVEFAARLPARIKVERPLRHPVAKSLPKRVYARMVSHDLADKCNKGWAQICVGDRSLARDPAFADAFADSSAAIAEAGLDTAGGRDARRRYVEEQLAGGFGASHSGRMMASFMLGRWLRRTDAVRGRPDHRSLMSSLMVIIPHGLSELVTKGEVVERYYNPGELFSRVDIVMTAEDRPDPAQVAPMVGDAELHLHSVPIPDGLSAGPWGFVPSASRGGWTRSCRSRGG